VFANENVVGDERGVEAKGMQWLIYINIQSWIHEQVILNYNQGAQLSNLLKCFFLQDYQNKTLVLPLCEKASEGMTRYNLFGNT